MIAAVKQLEAGRKAEDVAREVGVSTHTVYAWKSKYGGMDVSEAQEARRLRDENARLRKLVADLSLDKEALQSVIEKTDGASTPRTKTCPRGPRLAAMKASVEHIRPGKPTQNAYVESFNSKLREECLRVSWFQNLFEARRIIANWRNDYNQRRPHSSLNYRTPSEFAAKAGRGKDPGQACLKNDETVFHFPTATTAAG